jgi:hypothetical protein
MAQTMGEVSGRTVTPKKADDFMGLLFEQQVQPKVKTPETM